MSSNSAFKIQYFSPTIVRAEPYEFCLEYSEPGIKITFHGIEKNANSEGVLHFPTPQQWDIKYPYAKGQRERIRTNIISYVSNYKSLSFISDFIADENKIAIAEKKREDERTSKTYASTEEVDAIRKRILEMVSNIQR